MDPVTKRQAHRPDGSGEPASASKLDQASSAHSSGSRRLSPYVALRSLLLGYLSPILVDTVLNQAMFKRRLASQTLSFGELRDLAPDIMLGLRLFVEERRLPELMVSLAELLEQEGP